MPDVTANLLFKMLVLIPEYSIYTQYVLLYRSQTTPCCFSQLLDIQAFCASLRPFGPQDVVPGLAIFLALGRDTFRASIDIARSSKCSSRAFHCIWLLTTSVNEQLSAGSSFAFSWPAVRMVSLTFCLSILHYKSYSVGL